jgi:hypothetical protein
MAIPKSELTVPKEEQGSIIAFFYRIRFNPLFQEAFKATGRNPDGSYRKQSELPKPNPVVALFGLTEEQQRLIDELHELDLQPPELRDEKWEVLMQGATADVYKWTYQEHSAW